MTLLSLRDSMTYLCLILNGLFFYIVMGLGPPEFYWRGGEDNVFLLFVWRLPVLINIFVLLNMVPESFGQKKGVMTCLSLFGSVVVFVGTIFVWRAEWESFRSVDGGEVVVWSFMLLTSLMTIIVVKVYRPQRKGTTKVF